MHFSFVIVIEISHGVTDFTDIIFFCNCCYCSWEAPVVILWKWRSSQNIPTMQFGFSVTDILKGSVHNILPLKWKLLAQVCHTESFLVTTTAGTGGVWVIIVLQTGEILGHFFASLFIYLFITQLSDTQGILCQGLSGDGNSCSWTLHCCVPWASSERSEIPDSASELVSLWFIRSCTWVMPRAGPKSWTAWIFCWVKWNWALPSSPVHFCCLCHHHLSQPVPLPVRWVSQDKPSLSSQIRII